MKYPAQRKPAFYRQGALILLPAVIMAVFGLYSLRQDRVLAEHEASLQAQVVAGEMAEQLLAFFQQAMSGKIAPDNSIELRPWNEPVYRIWKETDGALAALLNESGRLLYPPSRPSMPLPAPLPDHELAPAAAELWERFQERLREAALDEAAELERMFAQTGLPEEFLAAGLKLLADGRMSEGDGTGAIPFYEQLLIEYPHVLGQSGYPLGLIAAFRLLSIVDWTMAPGRAENWLHSVWAHALRRPDPLAMLLLDRLEAMAALNENEAFSELIRSWREVEKLHERVRERAEPLAQLIADADSSSERFISWTTSEGIHSHLHVAAFEAEGCQVIFWNHDQLVDLAHKAVASALVPGYAGVGISLAGETVRNPGEGRSLALVESGLDEANPQFVRVQMVLERPEILYERVRTRSLLFGALLVVSAGAVVAGFISAWRAFRQQHELSEMRSNFVSSVSHEMRAPIASVRLMAAELEELGLADRRKAKEYHRFISRECQRLSALIENVLDFARQEQGRQEFQFESTSLQKLIREAAGMMQVSALEKQVQLDLKLPEEEIELEADGAALHRVLLNLLDNAIKHSPSGQTIELGLMATEESARFWVTDQGEGIPLEEREWVFERFYRRGSELRRRTQGIGLGLAIVRMIVQAHHGRVWVEGPPGGGACFQVELPLLQPGHSAA